VLVTLSCTLCPGLVMAVQKIACLSEQVTADIYDIGYFKELQRQYEVMSVPCMIVAGRKPEFGKKDIDGVLDWLLRDTNP
jgi:thioredoxin reductase (NADPH)